MYKVHIRYPGIGISRKLRFIMEKVLSLKVSVYISYITIKKVKTLSFSFERSRDTMALKRANSREKNN